MDLLTNRLAAFKTSATVFFFPKIFPMVLKGVSFQVYAYGAGCFKEKMDVISLRGVD